MLNNFEKLLYGLPIILAGLTMINLIWIEGPALEPQQVLLRELPPIFSGLFGNDLYRIELPGF